MGGFGPRVVAESLGPRPATVTDIPPRVLAVDLPSIVGLGPLYRAAAAFLVVLLLGGIILWWRHPIVERATVASTTRPLYSLLHGLAAHVVLAFGTVYMVNQLGPFDIAGQSAATIGLAIGGMLFLAVGALGFTIVGTIGVEYLTRRGPWTGLLVGAVVAAGTALLPPMYGGTLWVVLVSMGVGGPVRRWFHASSDTGV